MRKVIAAINMTIDGICDHNSLSPDATIHDHYTRLLNEAGVILYGSITYDLMKYWQDLLLHPSEEKSMNEFAAAIDNIPKIVFSHTLTSTGWNTAEIADLPLKEKVVQLKQQPGKDILVGSRSMIIQLLQLNLLDGLQLCIHPVVAGTGLPLFEEGTGRTSFRLAKTKTFGSGAILLYYEPVVQ